MYHSFDIDVAEKYGVHCAILLNHIWMWVEKNAADGQNFFDGTYWTYSSSEALAKLFPYLTTRQISYALKKLRDEGLIVAGNHNSNTYDRTLWYALTNFAKSILQNCKMDSTKTVNGTDNFVEPIPYNNIYNNNIYNNTLSNSIPNPIHRDIDKDKDNNIKTDNNPSGKTEKTRAVMKIEKIVNYYCGNDEALIDLVNDWLTMRRAKRAPNTERAVQSNLEKLSDYADQSGMTPHQYVDEIIRRGWQAFYVIDRNGGNGGRIGASKQTKIPDEYHFGEYI